MQKPKLEIVRIKAKNKGIKGTIVPSSRKEKKYMLITEEGRKIHFGATGMKDYLDTNDSSRRIAFHNRFRSNVNYNKPYTAMYLARLLW